MKSKIVYLMLMGLIKVTIHRDRPVDSHLSWKHVTACLLFRLLIEANDVSYCIHAPIHLCLFPSLSHHLRGHLASVISSCNESSRARQRLKMILVILIRGPYFNQITFCESRDEISDHQGVEELS